MWVMAVFSLLSVLFNTCYFFNSTPRAGGRKNGEDQKPRRTEALLLPGTFIGLLFALRGTFPGSPGYGIHLGEHELQSISVRTHVLNSCFSFICRLCRILYVPKLHFQAGRQPITDYFDLVPCLFLTVAAGFWGYMTTSNVVQHALDFIHC